MLRGDLAPLRRRVIHARFQRADLFRQRRRFELELRLAPHVDPVWTEELVLELRLQGVGGDREAVHRLEDAFEIALLERLDQLYKPAPNRPTPSVVLVLDNGPIHTSKVSTKALTARTAWLTVEWWPKYAPELNAIEHCWHDLMGSFLAHQTFASAEELEAAIHQAVAQRNQERQSQTCSGLPKAAYTAF